MKLSTIKNNLTKEIENIWTHRETLLQDIHKERIHHESTLKDMEKGLMELSQLVSIVVSKTSVSSGLVCQLF